MLGFVFIPNEIDATAACFVGKSEDIVLVLSFTNMSFLSQSVLEISVSTHHFWVLSLKNPLS